jgi:ubiquitin fusion degradation protein 1
MFGGLFGAFGGGFFDQNFRAYPVAFIEKESAEKGDKVILPPSSLNTLGTSCLFKLILSRHC